MRSFFARLAPAFLATIAALAHAQDAPDPLSKDQRLALDRISADSLKGHLSFLSSDLLEGRDTPSRGLDIASEYIAAQFRRAGLEPAGDDGYFQTARWERVGLDESSFSLEFRLQGETIRVPVGRVSVTNAGKIDVQGVPLVRVNASDSKAMSALTVEQVQGKAVVVEFPRPAESAALTGAFASRSLLSRFGEPSRRRWSW